jgi:DNA-binding CsgD family transcriptional regulator
MAKSQGLGGSRRGGRGKAAVAAAAGIDIAPGRVNNTGSRAMPGKVSRGALQRLPGERLSPLGRFILDKLDRGVVLLDAAGLVVDANTLGQRALARSRGVLVRNRRLTFADAAADDRFVRWLDGKQSTDGDGALGVTIRSADGSSCRVVISRAGTKGVRRNVAFVVVLYCPGGSREIGIDVLTRLYGLTRAQAGVARSLYAGNTVEQTAQQLALSRNTVRTHLKQIFSKCEVQSQAQLRHVLATGPRSL